MSRTGVFGGSFNPIHYGHLLLADEVLERLGLDRVLFVPAAIAPHKPGHDLAPAADRYRMAQLAVGAHPGFAVSDVELRRPGVSYTVDTLAALSAPGQELVLLLGSEMFLDLLSWREPQRIARLARLAVVPRVGSAFDPDSAAARKVLCEIGIDRFGVVEGASPPERGVLIVHATSLPISASELRARVRDGRSLAYRLPDPVIEYIRARNLYREGSGS